MPWQVQQDDRCPAAKPWAVVKESDGELEGCHPSKEAGLKQAAALYASEASMTDQKPLSPPRDSLIRAIFPGAELRAAEEETAMPTMFGNLAVFDQWALIDSKFEGTFMERLAHGAFAKTIAENRIAMRVTFNHGKDPSIGDKVLGLPEVLREEETGVYYEVPLFETEYNRELLPGLRAGAYGSSFRFRVNKEDFKQSPGKSAYNPDGLPERTIRDVSMSEFGPVTFPAYAGASTGVRSLTDDYLIDQLTTSPHFQALLKGTALPGAGAEPAHSDEGSRKPAPAKRFRTREEFIEWISRS